MARVSVKDAARMASARSREAAQQLDGAVEARREIPIRHSFVRGGSADERSPLSRLVSIRGRGGAVPLKLYLAVVWRCSGDPFTTEVLARRWATLLDLDEPATLGARRITKALSILEENGLVELRRRRGESTIITLLEESGTRAEYTLPSTASAMAKTKEEKERHRYFKVPTELWTRGYIQTMGAPALAMLLLLLADRNLDGRPTWWSVDRFNQYAISATNRTAGTNELEKLGLVDVKKELVDPSYSKTSFGRDRVRNTYSLRGAAIPAAAKSATAPPPKPRKRRAATAAKR